MFKKTPTLVLLISVILIQACTSEAEQKELDIIQSYLGSVKIETDPLPSGLYVIDMTDTLTEVGTQEPAPGDTLILTVKAYLAANPNTIFVDKPLTAPDTFIYNAAPMLPAWEEGISYIREHKTLKIISPSDLAYGAMRVGVIPPNSVLVFDITCLEHRY